MLRPPRSQSGTVLTEMAIFVPLFVALCFYFWDVMLNLISQVRHESSMVVLLQNYIEAPLKLESDFATATSVAARQMTSTEADAYLDGFTEDLQTILDEIGSGASYFNHDIAAELWYFTIDTSTGHATAATQVGTEFYGGASSRCFDADAATSFESFVSARTDIVLDAATNGLPPIGTRVFNITWDGAANAPYLATKAVTFVALCSKPGRVYTSAPIVTMKTLISPKELGY